jgi:uncharacterized repeat protein (TIGR03803 family)
MVQAQTATEVVLHNFAGPPATGANPIAGVVMDGAGNLYGTTPGGGAGNAGVVFKVDPSGNETVLHSFTGGADGGQPEAGVLLDAAGNLYGTTSAGGGTKGAGVVFKVDPTGHETVLYSFTGGADGSNPWAGVVSDASGNLYGTTRYGGTMGAGTVFKLDTTGHETVLYSFKGGTDGYGPMSGLALDAAGNLYGTNATVNGCTCSGIVYEVSPAGEFTVLYSFTGGADGGDPDAGVIRDSAGNLYGTASYGGQVGNSVGSGVVYKLDASGHETVLYNFTDGADGTGPYGGVILDSAGNLYGTAGGGASSLGGVIFKLDPAGHETVLYNFTGGAGGGAANGGLAMSAAGAIYGTTSRGGTAGAGAVFELATNGAETVLYSFLSETDGYNPNAGVISDSAGNLYGTTLYGGTGNAGVVYKLNTTGHETVLHSFMGGTDGANPYAGVTLDSAGNLYGTTSGGGSSGAGVVYKVDPSGHETVLYSFTGGADGGDPLAGVILDSAGNLYGTTYQGGSLYSGVVFKVDPTGHETVLFTASSGLSWQQPTAGVIFDAAGNLYGTTYNGSNVYKLDPAGNETVLYTFGSGPYDGSNPWAGVILDSAGNLYGTTLENGVGRFGTVYKLSASGSETVLYSFRAQADGGLPYAGVINDSSGSLYGTTYAFGSANAGVVYKVDSTGHETVLYSFTGGADGGNPYAGVISDAAGNLYGTTYGGGTQSGGVIFKIAQQYTITGQVTFQGAGLSGVTVTLSGSANGSVITDNNGNYGLPAAPGGSYTVTPFMAGYTFDPSSLTFAGLNANQTANFVAASLSFSISGQVLSVGGMPFGGVPINVPSGSAETDSSGNYSISVPAFGNYTVTPYLNGYYFSPVSATFSDLSANQTANFQIAATNQSDFNHGLYPDIVWQDPQTGAAQIWYLGGYLNLFLAAELAAPNPWRIVGIGDFNGDGSPDVVWQDPVSGAAQVWYLGGVFGNTIVSAANIANQNPWKIVAVADFNRDGHPDLVWQDPKSGAAQIWYLGGPQGTQLLGAANLSGPNSWRIAGAYNGVSSPDVYWQDPISGTVQIWYMGGTAPGAEGSQVQSAYDLTTNPWNLVAIADFNVDGIPDMMFQDPVSGSTLVLFAGEYPQPAPFSGPNPWSVVGPH